MTPITTIIFDWGGVLIADPLPLLVSVFTRTLGVPPDAFRAAYKPRAASLHLNRCSESDFWRGMCAELRIPPPALPSLWGDAFREVYLPIKEVWSLAQSLKATGYKIALLSNTELPGVKFFHATQPNIFDTLVFSCCEGCRKPEPRIYQLALERVHSSPDQAVFIDDSEHNLRGAEAVGLRTILFRSPRALLNDLDALGIRIPSSTTGIPPTRPV
jgi:FMN phosphatase YigB (HAD superfamily)